MISNLTILGFRTFRELHVECLTQVNLFVGTNNAGKSSILEATELVAMGTANALFRSPLRRGERLRENLETGGVSREVDLSHLFHGHTLRIGSSFSIIGNGSANRSVRCQVLEGDPDTEGENISQQKLPVESLSASIPILRFKGHNDEFSLPLSGGGGVPERFRRPLALQSPDAVPTVNFIGTENPDIFRLGRLWDALVLSPEEESIAEALRIIEPRIERIAFLSDSRISPNIFMKLSDAEQRLPIGSLGDGLKHFLALTLNLSSAKDGFLLVDEIDTGLHYTIMEDMWRLVIETAKRLNVQVFCTTHSLDCVRALARVRMKDPKIALDVTLHRVEKNATATVAYDMEELVIAAQSQLEVR